MASQHRSDLAKCTGSFRFRRSADLAGGPFPRSDWRGDAITLGDFHLQAAYFGEHGYSEFRRCVRGVQVDPSCHDKLRSTPDLVVDSHDIFTEDTDPQRIHSAEER